MAEQTGPPKGQLKYMTPFQIAADPPTPKPVPDVKSSGNTPAERAVARFSLAGKTAIGQIVGRVPYHGLKLAQ